MNKKLIGKVHFFMNRISISSFVSLFLSLSLVLIVCSCQNPNQVIRPSLIQEMAVRDFQEKGITRIKDTTDVGVLLINMGIDDKWYVAYNTVQTQPALLLYHITKADELPHFIPLLGKSEGKIEHVDFENVTNDDNYELGVEIHYDYDLAYQGREIVIIKNPFGNPASEIFAFPYEQVWEQIDTFDNIYGLPSHKKRIENHASFEFFEGYILLKGIINYRKNHLLEYHWDKRLQQFVLVLDKEYHEEDEESTHGHVHKTKGNKKLIEVAAHEDNCIAYLLEDAAGHVIDIEPRVHDELLCSRVAGLSNNGRYLVYTDHHLNAICIYDIETNQKRKILEDFDSYEGVSELVWAKGKKKRPRFGFVTVNHEELLENTSIYVLTIAAGGQIQKKKYKTTVYYECDLDGFCSPSKDYHYRFEGYDRFIYKREEKAKWQQLKIN